MTINCKERICLRLTIIAATIFEATKIAASGLQCKLGLEEYLNKQKQKGEKVYTKKNKKQCLKHCLHTPVISQP